MSPADAPLLRQLERSRALGFLGPGPVADHVGHARELIAISRAAHDLDPATGLTTARGATETEPPVGATAGADLGRVDATWLDLGSGGGLPGLVVAFDLPDQRLILVDANERRCTFLREACDALDRPDVTVLHGRAEDLARTEWRGCAGVVLARSFGRPSVTAECASGFLGAEGILVVSDRFEEDSTRWPAVGLADLGYGNPRHVRIGETSATVLCLHHPAERFPRRNGLPGKRPLW